MTSELVVDGDAEANNTFLAFTDVVKDIGSDYHGVFWDSFWFFNFPGHISKFCR